MKTTTKTKSTTKSKPAGKTVNKSAKSAKSTGKKAAAKTPTKKAAVKKEAKAPVSIPVLSVPAPVAENKQNKQSVTPKITFASGVVNLTHEGAKQFRAMMISRESFPAHLLAPSGERTRENLAIAMFAKDKAQIESLLARLSEIKEKISMSESRATAFRGLDIHHCYSHENVKIPSAVRLFGQETTDIKSRAAAALGFKPSKTHLIAGVSLN